MYQDNYKNAVAIIGIDGLFPKTANLNTFWDHLVKGKELSTCLSDKELIEKGVSEELIAHPDYVARTLVLEDMACFDASFFGLNPQMAKFMDPQNRKILESAWHAIENAGYSAKMIAQDFNVGVFTGKDYPLEYLAYYPFNEGDSVSQQLEILTGNETDYVANWIAYKFGFRGPAFNIQTACSTSLSALAVACQNLQLNYCELALVSSARLDTQGKGYLYQPNLMLSKDGLCKPLDNNSSGTLWGSAVVSLLLKPYEAALADKDTIHGLIRGIGVSNDGRQKQDFMAPGIKGQIEAINMAFERSGLSPDNIDYIELHGTGTKLGDPVEISALKNIYSTARIKPCVLGSVKANIGHTSACAGLSGLLKVILAFKHRTMPPMANFSTLNSHIKLDDSQFIINKQAIEWVADDSHPRRAGLSSFGFGGTNVHVLLEEAPSINRDELNEEKTHEIIFVSAKSEEQVLQLIEQFKCEITQKTAQITDIAYTSLVGREHFNVRSASVVSKKKLNEKIVFSPIISTEEESGYCLLFTGQGGYITEQMGRQLYMEYPVFRKAINDCKKILGSRLANKIWPDNQDEWVLTVPEILQPAIFMFQYALFKLWQSMGLPVDCVIGHSIGEIAASYVAGSLSLADALSLAQLRGEAFEVLPIGQGGMLVIFCRKDDLPPLVDDLVVAAYNAEDILVVSGPCEQLKHYNEVCSQHGILTVELAVTHSFHSPQLSKVAENLREKLNNLTSFTAQKPTIPMYSTVTGNLLQQSPDIDYWIKHLLNPTLFNEALDNALYDNTFSIALEIGPVSSLASLLKAKQIKVVPAYKKTAHKNYNEDVSNHFLQSMAQLYQYGFIPKADGLYQQKHNRIALPLYPFKKEHYWPDNHISSIKSDDNTLATANQQNNLNKSNNFVTNKEDILNLVCQYWCNHLGCSQVKADDDFFILGGTSLTAIQIQAVIKKELNISIVMLEFMTSRTPANLSEIIWNKWQSEQGNA